MNDAPPSDVAEISLIGTGYGESVMVHVGDGEWIIVDSCAEKEVPHLVQSSAVSYLKKIGVDLSRQVSLVFATHWHGDHIAGLSKVVGHCESADFCCAAVFNYKEFIRFACARGDADVPRANRSTGEIVKILEILRSRGRKPRFMSSDRLVHETDRGVRVIALSPSDAMIGRFMSVLAGRIPELKPPEDGTGDIRPNEASVVLLVDFGGDSVLLGADLEETSGRGWSAVVDGSRFAGKKKSSVYKVAHHGSKTGECAAVWEKLLSSDPFAVLTPFVLGRNVLPSEEDVDRILGRTPNAYSAASLGPAQREGVPVFPLNGTEAYGVRWKIDRRLPKKGHLRLRRSLGEPRSRWSVELRGGATRLMDIRT